MKIKVVTKRMYVCPKCGTELTLRRPYKKRKMSKQARRAISKGMMRAHRNKPFWKG